MLAKVVAVKNKASRASSKVDQVLDYVSRESGDPGVDRLQDYVMREGAPEPLTGPIQGGTFNLEGLSIDDDQSRRLISGLMNRTARQGKDMAGARSTRDPFYHVVLSWQPGESPTLEQADAAARHILAAVGLSRAQAFYAVHRDTDCDHIHVVACRFDPETFRSLGPGKRDYLKLDKACREIELAQGWAHSPGPHAVLDGAVARLTREQRGLGKDKSQSTGDGLEAPLPVKARMAEKQTGIPQLVTYLRHDRIAAEVLACNTWSDVHRTLAERGLRLERAGGGLVFTGHALGKVASTKASGVDYKLSQGRLEKRLGAFEPPPGGQPVAPTRRTYDQFIGAALAGRIEGLEGPGRTGDHDPERIARREARAQARDELAQRYKAEVAASKTQRNSALTALRTQHRAEQAQDRAALKALRPNRLRELTSNHGQVAAQALWALEKARRLQETKDRQRAELATLKASTSMAWPDWLARQAESGDEAALSALRGLRYREQRKAKKSHPGFEGEEIAPLDASTGAIGSIGGYGRFDLSTAQVEIDRRRQLITYRDADGQSRLTDSGPRIDVHRGAADQDAIDAGLRLAAAKFGSVHITGSAEFREQAALRAARLGIRLADPDLAKLAERSRTLPLNPTIDR